MQQAFYTVVHWLHITGAIMLLGTTFALRLVVMPALKRLEGETRKRFEALASEKAVKIIMHSISLLVITGIVNLVRALGSAPSAAYGLVLVAHVLLAMAVIVIAAMLFAPSEAFAKVQANRPKWMIVNIILGLTVVLLAATLRIMTTY